MPHHFRKLAGALAGVALAAGLTLAGTGTARADVPVPTGSWQEIFNPNLQATKNNVCADDPFASTAQFTALWLWHCHASDSAGISQRWTFFPTGASDYLGPTYYMFNQDGSDLCIGLDARMTVTTPYSEWSDKSLVQEPCTGVIDKQTIWNVVPATQSPDPNHQVEIVNAQYFPGTETPYCLAADNFRDTNGVRLVALPCSPYDSRQWWLI